jgi:hypothetical protein
MVCGLTGDAAHRQLLGQTLETIYASLTSNHGFSADHITVLWSEAKQPEDGPALTASVRPATREALAESVAKIQQSLQPQDALWVFVLGHAHYDGKVSWLNLPGPDMNQAEFAALFAPTNNQEQLFFMTTAASGYFIKPLSKPGRIVISATEADREVNETLFPHKLAAALAEPPPFAEFDYDDDGRLSLLDFYLHVTRQTAQDYADNELLATEHAQLDDNGDGRGTELQVDFLPEELGGRQGTRKPPDFHGHQEGALARQMNWLHPSAPPAPLARDP